jgi:hypothetical protein
LDVDFCVLFYNFPIYDIYYSKSTFKQQPYKIQYIVLEVYIVVCAQFVTTCIDLQQSLKLPTTSHQRFKKIMITLSLPLILILCTSCITSSAFGTNMRYQFGIVQNQQKQQQKITFTSLHNIDFTTRGGAFMDQHDSSSSSSFSSSKLLATPTSTTTSTTKNEEISITEYISTDNLALLSERGRIAISNLIQHDKEYQVQTHVYGNWPDAGTDDDGKRQLCEQVCNPNNFIQKILF